MNTFISDEILTNIAFAIIENSYSLRYEIMLLRSIGIVITKSSLHKLLHKRITKIDAELYTYLKYALNENYEFKHIRGGISTKNKNM